jgi:hypothetical protein
VAVLAGLVSIASPASADRVSPGHRISWGKAGVSLEDYWVDAAQCGHAAAAIDLRDTTPAKALVYGSRLLEDTTSPGEIMSVQQLVAPDIQWDRAATIMRQALETCLTGRGYMRFRLSASQFRHLRKLEPGSVERRQFLHRLASDASVLARQAIDRP